MDEPLICPITGEPVTVKATGDGRYWFGIVTTPKGGYQTSLFLFKEQCVDFFRQRDGKLCGKPENPKIEVREPPLIPDVVAEERQGEQDVTEITKVAAGRAVRAARNAGLRK